MAVTVARASDTTLADTANQRGTLDRRQLRRRARGPLELGSWSHVVIGVLVIAGGLGSRRDARPPCKRGTAHTAVTRGPEAEAFGVCTARRSWASRAPIGSSASM